MSERATIWQDKGGRGVDRHQGHPQKEGRILAKHYNSEDRVTELLDIAHNKQGYLASLGASISECDVVPQAEGMYWEGEHFGGGRHRISDGLACNYQYEYTNNVWWCTDVNNPVASWPIYAQD